MVNMANMANKDANKTLGQVIRDVRLAVGTSLREFARTLEITPSYQSDIENDRRIPAEEVLKRIAALLSLDFEELMALSGRIGDDARCYLRYHPTAGALLRKLSEMNVPEDILRKMLQDLIRVRSIEMAKQVRKL
jgi:transcriptional regulator with XRE-family HTH domain